MPPQIRRNYLTGIILSSILALCLFAGTYCMGRLEFFRYLNHDLGGTADLFFRCWTFTGDGIIWVPVFVLVIIYRRKFIPLIISAIVLSTLITQSVKHLLFPGLARPSAAMDIKLYAVHTVTGVELLTADSFPSGHTATAFSVFLLGCLLIPKRWIIPVGFLYAALAGYSRIYLAEHFPLDVAGGILAAMIAVSLSILIQKKWHPLSYN